MACPALQSVTLVTARDDLGEAGFPSICVDKLSESESVLLLRRARCHDHRPCAVHWTQRELAELGELATKVGRYALALDVMRARIRLDVRPSDILRELQDLDVAPTMIDDDLVQNLPTGHASSIVRTLQGSMIDVVAQREEAKLVLLLLGMTKPEPTLWWNLVDGALESVGSPRRAISIIPRLVRMGLLASGDRATNEAADQQRSDDDAPDAQTAEVHAITRMVARHLLTHHERPLEIEPQEIRRVAWSAAQWFHARGDSLRNHDDIGAVPWFERALFPMAQYESEATANERIVRAACWRGIARAEFRAPSAAGQDARAESEERLDEALRLAKRAEEHVKQGLVLEPDSPELLVAEAQTLALQGILMSRVSDGLRASGKLSEALELSNEATHMVRRQSEIRSEAAERIEGDPQADPSRVHKARTDAARAPMNLPTVLISRAKILRDLAAEGNHNALVEAVDCLDEATRVYDDVEQRRRAIFSDKGRVGEQQEIAASLYGRAVVSYVRGCVVPAHQRDRLVLLLDTAEELAEATRVRASASLVDASKCVLLSAKLGLAVRALIEEATDFPWKHWISWAHGLRVPAGHDSATLPDADDFPAALDTLLGLATTPEGEGRDDFVRSRDAATLAILDALDQFARVDRERVRGSATMDDVASVAMGLTQASAAWLALTEALGLAGAQRVTDAMADWADEAGDWLPDPRTHLDHNTSEGLVEEN
jgi:hypothetical protein